MYPTLVLSLPGPPNGLASRDFAAVMAQTSAASGVFVILSTYSIK
jgi:hypothetical protein